MRAIFRTLGSGAALLILANVAPVQALGEQVNPFRPSVPGVGMRVSDTFVYTMTLASRAMKDGQVVRGQTRTSYKSLKKEELVLAADEIVTRARVYYSAVEEKDEDEVS